MKGCLEKAVGFVLMVFVLGIAVIVGGSECRDEDKGGKGRSQC